jgi:hypothetical protein
VWWLIGERAELGAELERAQAEAESLRESHKKELAARDAALVVRRWELEQAEERTNALRGAIDESDETCFSKPVPSAVLDRLPK